MCVPPLREEPRVLRKSIDGKSCRRVDSPPGFFARARVTGGRRRQDLASASSIRASVGSLPSIKKFNREAGGENIGEIAGVVVACERPKKEIELVREREMAEPNSLDIL